jgi:hypothetical protein
MRNEKTMKTRTGLILFAIGALVLTSAMSAGAQLEQSGQTKQPQPGSMDMSKMMQGPAQAPAMTEAKMMEGCQEMKEQKQKMAEDMKAQDDQLSAQLTQMNRAPEDQKMGLMAAVVTNMVEQRITMDARKAKMEEAMMNHMMQHMQMGKESMAQCPMMKDMKDMAEKSAVAHKGHQEGQK